MELLHLMVAPLNFSAEDEMELLAFERLYNVSF